MKPHRPLVVFGLFAFAVTAFLYWAMETGPSWRSLFLSFLGALFTLGIFWVLKASPNISGSKRLYYLVSVIIIVIFLFLGFELISFHNGQRDYEAILAGKNPLYARFEGPLKEDEDKPRGWVLKDEQMYRGIGYYIFSLRVESKGEILIGPKLKYDYPMWCLTNKEDISRPEHKK